MASLEPQQTSSLSTLTGRLEQTVGNKVNKNTSVIIVTKSGTVYIGHLDKDQDLRYLLEVPPTTGVVVLNDAHVKTPAFFSPVAMVCVAAMQIESFSVLID